MRRTAGRVRSRTDVRRLGAGVSYPGIDPRFWFKLGVVQALGFDADEGPFADVLFANGDKETCMIGSQYTGAGFGEWSGLKDGDLVCVGISSGDPNEGCVLLSRLWNKADPPFPEMGDGEDLKSGRIIRIERNEVFKVLVNGDDGEAIIMHHDNKIEVKVDKINVLSDKVNLATEDGKPVARKADPVNAGYLVLDSTGLVKGYVGGDVPPSQANKQTATNAANSLIPPGTVVEMTLGVITDGSGKTFSG